MFSVDPKSFADSRIQLHWASQLLSATADAALEKQEDDSHSNLGWDASLNRLVGRAGVSIDVEPFELLSGETKIPLSGKTLEQSADWLSDIIGKKIRLRDYDMPEHAVANGASFDPNKTHLAAQSKWLSMAQLALKAHGRLRIWPHHFDMGFWIPLSDDGKSIGGGFSLGDKHYSQPYFYVNAYGIDNQTLLPKLATGHWAKTWTGAVLTSEDLEPSDDPMLMAIQFANDAVEIVKQLLDRSND